MPANPYAVDFGAIPFSSAPGAMFGAMGGSPAQAMSALGPAYQSSYNAAMNFNKALGETTNRLYGTTMEQQLAAQQGILGLIDNYGGSSRADITAANTKQQGDAMQSMISRGLGNTTVLDSAKRGLNDDLARQNLQLDDQLAAMRANYRNMFSQQNTGLALNQAGFLERMTGQYPNAGLYGQLASQFGAAGQSAANQAQVQDALRRGQQAAAGGGGVMGAVGGGGGGQRQSAFGPAFSGVTSPGFGPMQTGSGVGVGAGAFGGGFSTGYGGGGGFDGLFGGALDWGNNVYNSGGDLYDTSAMADYGGGDWFGDLAPVGGDLSWYDPWGMYSGGDAGYSDPGFFGGAVDWAGSADSGGGDWSPFMDEWSY